MSHLRGGNRVKIKDLLVYISENIDDGSLTMESQLKINDGTENVEAGSLYNDCKALTIGV